MATIYKAAAVANGSTDPWDASAAFDENDVFTGDNWNDPFINLFRHAFAPAEHTDDPIRIGLLTIRHHWHNDQNYYLIEDFYEGLYIMSVYKHRGRTEAFYEAATGRPITRETARDLYEQMTDPNYHD